MSNTLPAPTSLVYFFKLGAAIAGVPQVHVMGVMEKGPRTMGGGVMAIEADFIWVVQPDGRTHWIKSRFGTNIPPRTVELFLGAVDRFASRAARVNRTLVVEGSSVEPTAGALEEPRDFYYDHGIGSRDRS